MVKKILIFLFGFNLHLIANSQSASYWQQHVDYEIHVALDDEKHILNGNIKIKYTNNSPDTLQKIWMHLWPNAYKNTQTALAQQLLANGSDVMLKAKQDDLGFIDSIAFNVDGQDVRFQLDVANLDIGSIDLNTPLLPGKTISIETPFRVKIPISDFSRLGHSGQAYQITQWYPKPAVYDRKGWHPMPYLNQGEFYSEFGNFNVYITLPDNYIVGASGDLQTESEIVFLNQIALQTSSLNNFEDDLSFPPSSATKKTLHYYLENAHDFAWFADKRYHVLKGQVTLPFSQRSVTTWSFFTNFEAELWKKSIDYLNQSVLSYSDWVGEYPYNVAQAVEGALSAGAGMEYPTITVIGESGSGRGLDNVIAHEVGHNWFYGILGSNERDHAWMDEGINSYYEDRYIAKYYGRNIDPSIIGLGDITDSINFLTGKSLTEVVWIFTAGLERMNKTQPIDIPSTEFSSLNYGLIVYLKTAYLFAYLADFLGQSQFDRIMAQYYREWQFKHPYPEDLQKILETETGENLNWFFTGLLKNERSLDYKVKDLIVGKTTISVRVQNNTEIPAPFPVSLMHGDSIIRTEWQRGFTGAQNIFIRIPQNAVITHVRIDANETTPDNLRENNTMKMQGLLKKIEPLNIKPLIIPDNPNKTTISFLPIAAGNANDGFMLGLGVWNSTFPAPKFEYVLAPMFSFKLSEFVGQGSLGFNFYPEESLFSRVRLSLTGAHYHTGPESEMNYYKLQPQLDLQLKPQTFTSEFKHYIRMRSVFIQENDFYLIADQGNEVEYYTTDDNWFFEIKYSVKRKNLLHSMQLNVAMQQHESFLKPTVEFFQKIAFPHYRRGINFRLFAGYFADLDNSSVNSRYNYTISGTNGAYDYLYDDIFLARNTEGMFFSNQIVRGNGYFKLPYYNEGITTSDKFLTALNIKAPIPKLPLALFADFGLHGGTNLTDSQNTLLYDAGVMIQLAENIFEVYFPLIASSDFPDIYSGNYSQYISVLINLNALNGFEILRTLEF